MDRDPQHIAMEGLRDTERVSVLLSKLIERRILGSTAIMDFKRRSILRQEYMQDVDDTVSMVFTGSRSEGMDLIGSDIDFMFVDKHVEVLYPSEDRIPPDSTQKTVLYVREADCRPGYVMLQLGYKGRTCTPALLYSFVPVGNVIFVSSDLFREHLVKESGKLFGKEHASSGPSSSDGITDMVVCFQLSSWPRVANQWVTRPRLYGWPTQAIIDKIVAGGCHVVPVGDKCSEDTMVQWRLSFVSAERLLVHTFGHIQMKVYFLLKYFLKQMKVTLQNILGKEDDDILCSYHMKTVMFSALENSHPKFWQEHNLFYCFWFCFNILISCVRVGHFPQYFIPTNNLFQRKVHGQNQHKLVHILQEFHSKKLFCLLNVHMTRCHVNILEYVSNAEVQTNLMRAQTAQEKEYTQDMFIRRILETPKCTQFAASSDKSMTWIRSMHLLMNSDTEDDELLAFVNITECITSLANTEAQQYLTGGHTNKTRYQNLRKCQHRLTLCASMGTNILKLATFCFLTGNYSKALDMCQRISLQPSYFTEEKIFLPKHLESVYMKQYCGKGFTSTYKLRKTFTNHIYLCEEFMHLPHFNLEVSRNKSFGVLIPPRPYALFLSFLCCHELRDKSGRDEVQRLMIMAQTEDYHPVVRWIVRTMLGICYETIGDYHRAIRAYQESAKTLRTELNCNPALERIEALLRFVTK